MEVDADFMQNSKHVETSLDLHYGPNSKDFKKRILFSQELDYVGNFRNLKVDHVSKLKWKAMVSFSMDSLYIVHNNMYLFCNHDYNYKRS